MAAFYIFLKYKVDVAIVEVGIGGRFDCTNILPCPVVCGVTTLSLEHTNLLGNSLHEIAWHKFGIFKKGSHAFLIDQTPNTDIHTYARLIADDVGCILETVGLESGLVTGTTGKYQVLNASLALAISRYWQEKRQKSLDFKQSVLSLRSTQVVGRQHIVNIGRNMICLDVAHTPESLDDTLNWFTSMKILSPKPSVLVFFCSSPRKPEYLMKPFIESGIFHTIYWPILQNTHHESLDNLLIICKERNVNVVSISSKDFTALLLNEHNSGVDILVCGSFYVVGEFYNLITSSLQY